MKAIKEIVFKTSLTVCPVCHTHLVVYKTVRRTVKSIEMGEFVAVHKLMICKKHKTIFRSEELASLIGSHCIYANDVMVETGNRRYIGGRSCSEISKDLDIGISERQVRNLSNTAMQIFTIIHEENIAKIRESMKSYILSIDGTVDSEYSMIVVVRDTISGFTLYAKKCSAESYEEIKSVMEEIKLRFGEPAGIISDMRSGILSAAKAVFPDVPKRICLMHFLRDLGKDLMDNMHIELGKAINRKGIKNALKRILRSIPIYDQETLDDLKAGFCRDRNKMEQMAIRRIIEPVVMHTGSSGYGFPFTLKNLNFYELCKEALNKLEELSEKINGQDAKMIMEEIKKLFKLVTANEEIKEQAEKLAEVNKLFQKLRIAFKVPDHGNLSEDLEDDDLAELQTSIVIEELKVYMGVNIPAYLYKSAKHIIEKYEERKELLFSNNKDHTIPRTNNEMEQFFRKIRRNVRKRTGNTSTGRLLAINGESLALFQNMGNEMYVKLVFGTKDLGSTFGKYRKLVTKKRMKKSQVLELVDKGIEKILTDTLSETPYNLEFMEKAYNSVDLEKI